MLAALSAHIGLRIDVPLDQLTARERRIVMHGAGDDWIEVKPTLKASKNGKSAVASTAGQASSGTQSGKSGERPLFRFQYKGLYPALEEAARLSPAMRGKLDHLVDDVECSVCGGSRLNELAAAVRLHDRTIDEIGRTPLGKLIEELNAWQPTGSEKKIAGDLLREIRSRMQFLVDVGLEYLTLSRLAPTLSGGEAQRIRLASQVGSGLCGVLYVLDEPTIGLHPRDNRRLLGASKSFAIWATRCLVVEHDREVLANADQLLDFGPGAGEFGGQIVARGKPQQVAKSNTSVTGPYLSGKKTIAVPTNRRSSGQWSVVSGQKKAEGGKRKAEGLAAGLAPHFGTRVHRNHSAHGTTTCATSMSAFHWARSRPSLELADRERVRSSKTCCTNRWPARCIAPVRLPACTMKFAAWNTSTK